MFTGFLQKTKKFFKEIFSKEVFSKKIFSEENKPGKWL